MKQVADWIRWGAIFMAAFNAGIIAALFLRIGRHFIPKYAMRLLIVGYVFTCASLAGYAHDRLGQPATFSGVVGLIGLSAQFAAFMALYRWYGSDSGRAHIARMTGSIQAHDRKNGR